MAVRGAPNDSEMNGPALKRICSSTIKRIAVEGNIGTTDTGVSQFTVCRFTWWSFSHRKIDIPAHSRRTQPELLLPSRAHIEMD